MVGLIRTVSDSGKAFADNEHISESVVFWAHRRFEK
jgi:hypothetical protein